MSNNKTGRQDKAELFQAVQTHGLARNTEGVQRGEDIFSVVSSQHRLHEDYGIGPNDKEHINRYKEGKVRCGIQMCVSGKPQACLPNSESTGLSLVKSLCGRVMAEKAKKKPNPKKQNKQEKTGHKRIQKRPKD